MNKKHFSFLLITFAACLSYFSINTNHNSLLYKQFDLTVSITSGNLNSIRIFQIKEGVRSDFTPHFVKEESAVNSLHFYLKKFPVRDLEIVSLDPHTVIDRVEWPDYVRYYTGATLGHHGWFNPIPMASGAVNYQGNLFFVGIFLMRWLGFWLGLLLVKWLVRRYFYNYYLLLFLPVALTKIYFAIRLEMLDDSALSMILIVAVFAETACWLIINLLYSLLSKTKIATKFLYSLLTLYVINFIMNLVHFYYTNQNLRVNNLRFFDMTSLTSVTSLAIVIYCTIIIIPLISYAYIIIRQKNSLGPKRNRTLELILLGILLFGLGLYNFGENKIVGAGSSILDNFATRRNYVEIMMPSMLSFVEEVANLLFPGKRTPSSLNSEDMKKLNELGIMNQTAPYKSFPIKKIILIPVESLSSQLLHYYNPAIPEIVTSELDRLIRGYPHLDNFYTTREPTLYGLLALLASNIDMNKAIQPGYLSLPKQLNKEGFQTVFVQGMDRNWGNYSYYFDRFGFKTHLGKEYFTEKYPTTNQNFGWGFSDKIIFTEIIDQLKKCKANDKLFLTVLTIDTHMPGGRVDPDLDLQPVSNISNPLLVSLYSTDQLLKKLMDTLNREQLIKDDTLIILTADHSSPLHANYNKIDGVDSKRLINRVPLVFITGNKSLESKLQQITTLYASQIDIAPTLMGILGLAQNKAMIGKDLLVTTPDFAITYNDEIMEYISPRTSYVISKTTGYASESTESALQKWLQGLVL